jgi:hypothetical protein
MSSSPWERLWNGDEDVTTPALAFGRGGDVLIATGRALERRRGRRHPGLGLWTGRRCPHRRGKGFGTATMTSPPRSWPLDGAAMSSSPRERLWNGDEDVTTPALGFGRGGDVLIAMGKALERRRGRHHPGLGLWTGRRCPHRHGKGLGRATRTSLPRCVRGLLTGERGCIWRIASSRRPLRWEGINSPEIGLGGRAGLGHVWGS